jgi:hypothetical protein
MSQLNRRKRYNITPEDFVRTWQRAESAKKVTKLLDGMPWRVACARAAKYRKMGVHLKKFKDTRTDLLH